MADSILRLKVESQEYDNKLKQATNGLTRYVDECRKVGSTLDVVEKETLDYVRAIGQMDTTSRTATGKLAEMKKTFTELSAQYKQMTDAEKQSPFGKALAESLDQLKGRIGESKAQLDDINKSINGGGGLTGALDNMLGKVGLNVEGLMKFGGAAGVATTALKVAKDAFFASETSLDEWGRTVQSSQSLYQGFLSALNNSDISGFLSRMDEIVSAARDAYNAMDELGTFSAFQQRNVAKGRAGYAQALDEYRLNPTADNKQKLQQANQKVMNDLRESHDKTEAAYQAALRQIATERISGKGMQDAFVKMFSEGNYGDLQAAKSSYKTGRGLNSGAQYYYGDRVYDGRVQDRTTGKWRDMSDTEKQQFEFARALSQVNDSQIKEVQALGAQSIAITEQIYQQDRAYNRLAGNNAPLRGGATGGSRGGTTHKATPKTEEQQNAARIDKLIKQYQDLATAAKTANDAQKAGLTERMTKIQGEIKTLQDRNTELKKFADEARQVQFPVGSLPQLNEQLKTLQTEQAKALDAKQWKDYQQQIEQTQYQIDALKGKWQDGLQASFRLDDEDILEDLRYIEGMTIDPKTFTATANTADAYNQVEQLLKSVGGKTVTFTVLPKMEMGTSIQNDAGMSAYIASIKQQLETADYGTSLYNGLSAQLADMSTLQALVGESLKAGLGTAMFDAADETGKDFWTRAMEGGVDNIDWQTIADKINEARKAAGLDTIVINFKTGGLKEAGKDANTATKDFQKAASAIGSVGSALSSIEDPSAKVAGIVAQAIATVASAFAGALGTDQTTKSNIWAFIAAAAASTATMISTIASIHSATGYAQGGVIKGNSYSGDNILGMVDGGTGGFVGLNAGEIVLNQAQTANVANALEGSGMRGIDLSASVSGEQILLVANRTTRRQGRGELVTWK